MNEVNTGHVAFLKSAIASRALIRAVNERVVQIEHGSPRDAAWLFDFRRLLLDPEWLDTYAEIFWDRFAMHAPFQVGGMETAAIPLVTAIVMKGKQRGTPVSGFYIRKSRDRDGLMRQIEGTLTDQPIILVDDLINTGSSFQKQVTILEANGHGVAHIFAILAFRDVAAYEILTKRGICVHNLFSLDEFDTKLPDIVQTPQELFETIWKFSPGDPGFEHVNQKSAPVLDTKHIYFGSDKGTFYALDQNTGAVVWQFETGAHPSHKGIFSSPIIHDDVVYFGAYDGNVYALDAKTGKKRWTNSDADWIGSSPALAPEKKLLYIGLEFGLFRKRGGIAAIDMKTGVTTWKDRTSHFTHGSPLYIPEEGIVIIGSNDCTLYAYDAESGTRRWLYQTSGDLKTKAAYDAKRRQVVVASYGGPLYAFGARDGAVRWAYSTGGLYSNPLIQGDVVYIASLDKSLYCLNLETGKKKWAFSTGGRIFASPILVENSLFIGSNDGKLYELDPESGRLRGSHQFSERIVNAIAYNPATKHFFVPTVANELYCLMRR